MNRKEVLHISTECYPVAKAGGMGDVVGSLPIYLPKSGVQSSVIIPKYDNAWIENENFKKVFGGEFLMGEEQIKFSIELLSSRDLGFPLFVVNIPGKFDRQHIYLTDKGSAYLDEAERNISFQRSILSWLNTNPDKFNILHCHDHMTGLMSFMMQYHHDYKSLRDMPTVFTIHNGQYRGIFDWSKESLLGDFDIEKRGLLEWDGMINSLATAIKCSWKITTVSPSYLEELQDDFDNLTSLARFEKYKSVGIINGIDATVWNPKTDVMIYQQMKRSARMFKKANKDKLAKEFAFKPDKALVSFIGRFAYEKSADLLEGAFKQYLKFNSDIHFFILGSGDKDIEVSITKLKKEFPDNVTAIIAYDESLAHKIYAASDFILMPSRFEPCGLNQMYAMRYGTIPIVRFTGGLKDTVPDIGDNGNGISFLRANEEDIVYSLERAEALFIDRLSKELLVNKIMELDFSWENSARLYSNLYTRILNGKT